MATYSENRMYHNWLQSRWEYMNFHPAIKSLDLTKAIVLENDSKVIGIIHPEHEMGTAFIQIDPLFTSQRYQLLRKAEKVLSSTSDKTISIFINPLDTELEDFARALGYSKDDSHASYMLELETVSIAASSELPPRFKLKILQDANNLSKISKVIHRGFNHPGEPPPNHVNDILFMQSAPSFRKDLTIVIESPEGAFATYCGILFEHVNHFAYIEPVATDPNYRRMGLGKIAVLEAIRQSTKQGAKKAFVGSGQSFYRNIGFKEKYQEYLWTLKC